MSHFKVNSLAKAQMNKIEGLLKKARGRHDVMLVGDRYDRYEDATSKIARADTVDKSFNAEFETVDVRRSLQVNSIKKERSLEKTKKTSP